MYVRRRRSNRRSPLRRVGLCRDALTGRVAILAAEWAGGQATRHCSFECASVCVCLTLRDIDSARAVYPFVRVIIIILLPICILYYDIMYIALPPCTVTTLLLSILSSYLLIGCCGVVKEEEVVKKEEEG